MLSRLEKAKQIEVGQELFDKSRSLIFVDFSGKTVEELKVLRRTLKAADAKFKVIKKRLLKIVFDKKSAPVDPETFNSQVGTVFAGGDIVTIAGPVYKSGFTILGGYAVGEETFLDGEAVKAIGQLPSREALLGQLAGMLLAPIRMFMYVLQEQSRKGRG